MLSRPLISRSCGTDIDNSMQRVIPAELVDLILFHLGKDFAALRSSSLVCRTWTLLAYPYIFEELQLDIDDCNRPRNDTSNTSSLAGFVDFLRNSPRMRRYIRKLKIVEGSFSKKYRTLNGPGLDCIALGQCLLVLPEMIELDLRVQGFRFGTESQCIHPNESPTARLDKLVIRTFWGAEHIPSVLCMFAQISDFVVRYTQVKGPLASAIIPRTFKVQLRHLALQHLPWHAMSAIVNPLSSALDLTRLTHLSVGNYGYEDNILELLLPQLGAHLTELCFTGGTSHTFQFRVMSFCKNLTTLRFQIILAEVSYIANWAKAWPIAMQIIIHAPQSLRELCLDISTRLYDIINPNVVIDNEIHDSMRVARLVSSLDFGALELALRAHSALAALHITINNGRGDPYLTEVGEALALVMSRHTRDLLKLSAGRTTV